MATKHSLRTEQTETSSAASYFADSTNASTPDYFIPIQQTEPLVSAYLDRVRAHSPARVNALIDAGIRERLQLYARSPQLIDKRLGELEREWDIDRAIETGASTAGMVGLILGLIRRRRFLMLPVLMLPTLFLHATQGWTPQMYVLRRFGLRSRREIELEKYALKMLRGDFGDLDADTETSIKRAVDAVRKNY